MRGRNNSSKERTRRPDKRGEFIGWSRNEILLTSRAANYARVFTELFRDHRQRVVYWSFRSSTVHGHTTRRLILRRTEGFIQISTVFPRCTFFFFSFLSLFLCLPLQPIQNSQDFISRLPVVPQFPSKLQPFLAQTSHYAGKARV